MLSHVHLMNLIMNPSCWQNLGKGLAHAKCLHTLKINLCDIDYACLNGFVGGMKFNASIVVLDFSYNNIKDNCGDLLARILSDQTQRRD